MWWEWWEKQKTNIQQISRTPTSCGSFSLCYFEDAKRQATGPDKFGQSMVTSHSFSPPHLGSSGRHASAKYFLPAARGLVSNLSLVWYSRTGLVYWVLLVWSWKIIILSSPRFHSFMATGMIPLFLSIPHATGVFNFRMGLLYFGRWKECKIHGFLHSLLLRWSRDFKPGSWMGR